MLRLSCKKSLVILHSKHLKATLAIVDLLLLLPTCLLQTSPQPPHPMDVSLLFFLGCNFEFQCVEVEGSADKTADKAGMMGGLVV